MSIDSIISQAAAEALKALYGAEFDAATITPQTTKKEFEGNLTIVVFPFLKISRKSPEATAQEIGEYMQQHCDAVQSFNVIKGFLNITIEPKFWTGVLNHIAATPDYGFRAATPESTGKKGDHLIGDFYVAFDKHYKEEVAALEAKGMSKEEAEAASPLMQEAREMLRRWEAGDEEVRSLWRTMNSWVYAGFDETYKRLGVDFDKIYYESETYLEGKKKVLEGLEKGIMYRKPDNSVWADLTADGLDHKLLLRSDGTSVYMTQDIGTAKLRYQDYPIDKMIYVVGNEQNYHFQVLSLLLDKLGFKWGKDLVHFSYGMVELPEGKMKSREGTVVDADDLMDEMVATAKEMSSELGKLNDCTKEEADHISTIIGLGALKYFILKVDPRKNMTFNPKESIDFNGNTGSFIQYTYARIRSVLRKADAEKLCRTFDANAVKPNEKEIALIQRLADFPSIVEEAGQNYSPALIANYAYELVKEYNQFYHDYRILGEENPDVRAFRLTLSATTAEIVRRSMWLLGIEVPERM